MFSRRGFLAATTGMGATVLAAPAIGHSGEGFVVEDRFQPQDVEVRGNAAPGTLIVSPRQHFLFWITAPGKARRFGVGVGKAGLGFRGTAIIERKAKWPFWRPTRSMIRRNPAYARFRNGVRGGPNNPLGARALYLYQDGVDTYYRIHGTTDPSSIGRSVSNGCVRMVNEHVEELYELVPVGTEVVVL